MFRPFIPLFAAMMLVAAPARAQEKPAVTLRVARLPEIDKTIASLKGKVVVVDFWEDS